jgi:tRNA threonylcarbamoyladenosine biosynthesis protein TsaB
LPPEAWVLAIDTSAAHCAAALLSGGRAFTHVELMAKGQAERLVPMLDEMLARESVAWADIGVIAVGVGPGNFTGIRIAVALARGLALGLGVPAVGVTGFEAVAEAAGAEVPFQVALPAPRGQVYLQAFGLVESLARIAEADEVGAGALQLDDVTPDRFVAAIARVGLRKAKGVQPRPAPFYLRGADAAPSSDPPPVMLP